MKIAMIQMKVNPGQKEENIKHAFELLHEAAQTADLLVLPEVWTTGYDLRDVRQNATVAGDGLLESLASLAKETGKYILPGSIPYLENDNIYNHSCFFGPEGLLVTYDKVHLFSLLAEPRYFTGGRQRVTAEMNNIKMGFTICYDLRFPELYRSLALDGATLVMVPSEWPISRNEPWKILNRARAIENQIYICAVNAVGVYKDNIFHGNSMLVAPDGKVVAQGGDKEEIIYGDYDDELIKKVRNTMSVWEDRREDVYR